MQGGNHESHNQRLKTAAITLSILAAAVLGADGIKYYANHHQDGVSAQDPNSPNPNPSTAPVDPSRSPTPRPSSSEQNTTPSQQELPSAILSTLLPSASSSISVRPTPTPNSPASSSEINTPTSSSSPTGTSKPTPSPTPSSTAPKPPAEATDAEVARTLIVGFKVNGNAEAAQANMRAAARIGIGGTYLTYVNNASDLGFDKNLYDELDNLSHRRLLITNDDEGGLVLRDTLPNDPSAQEKGKKTAAQVRAIGKQDGKLLRSYGIMADLAPVLDVPDTHDPNHGAITSLERSYGGGPTNIANKAGAELQGLQSEGVLGVAKHFPGIGEGTPNSNTDAHKVTSAPLAQLEKNDIPQYRALIKKGLLKIVMTSNEYVRGLDLLHPASLSAKVVGYLKHTLHFNGLVVSDSLTGPAKYTHQSIEKVIAESLNAGVDMPLFDYPGAAKLQSIINYVKKHVPASRIIAADDKINTTISSIPS